jgi:hypothetical protein
MLGNQVDWTTLSDSENVYVSSSRNLRAGAGLFTRRQFEKDEIVAIISGPIVRVDKLTPMEKLYAVGDVAAKVIEDGVEYERAINPLFSTVKTNGHMANSPFRDPEKRSANVRFSANRTTKIVTLKALGTIPKDTEILVDYGEERTEVLRQAIDAAEAEEMRAKERLVSAKREICLISDSETVEALQEDVDKAEERTKKLRLQLEDEPVVPYRRNEAHPTGVPRQLNFEALEDVEKTLVVSDDSVLVVDGTSESVIVLPEASIDSSQVSDESITQPTPKKFNPKSRGKPATSSTTESDDESFGALIFGIQNLLKK